MIQVWKFSRIPEDKRAEVRAMVDRGDWKELMRVQNKYKLSGQIICCDTSIIKEWFQWAIRENKI